MTDADRASLLALLRKVEWAGVGSGADYGWHPAACPFCDQQEPLRDGDDDQRPWVGHKPDCELAAWIGRLSGG